MVMPITCLHGDIRYVPARMVTIAAEPRSWRMDVGVIPLLLGRDWSGFDCLLSTTMQSARQRQPHKGGVKRDAP